MFRDKKKNLNGSNKQAKYCSIHDNNEHNISIVGLY